MQLKKLEIEGFRGFSNKQVIRFPKDKQPVVFVGVNGAGKTSILDAIINCLQHFQTTLSSGANIRIKLERYSPNDVNINKSYSKNYLTWEWSSQYDEIVTGFEFEDSSPKFIGSNETVRLTRNIRGDADFYRKASLPIMVSYPSNRSFNKPNVRSKKTTVISQYHALYQAFEPSVNFSDFFEWFRNTEDIENEKRLTENNTFTEPSLEAVRLAIMAFLDDFSKLRIQRSPIEDMVVYTAHGLKKCIKKVEN